MITLGDLEPVWQRCFQTLLRIQRARGRARSWVQSRTAVFWISLTLGTVGISSAAAAQTAPPPEDPGAVEDALHYLPTRFWANGLGRFHSRLGGATWDDLPQKAVGNLTSILMSIAKFFSGCRDQAMLWAAGLGDNFRNMYPTIDGYFYRIHNALADNGLVPVGVFVIGVGTTFWRWISSGMSGQRTLNARPIVGAVLSIGAVWALGGAAGRGLNNTTCDMPGVQECEFRPYAGGGPGAQWSPSWIIDTTLTAIQRASSSLTEALGDQQLDLPGGSNYPSDINCDTFRDLLEDKARGTAGGPAVSTAVISDQISQIILGYPWAYIQFGDVEEGRRIDCWLLNDLSGISQSELRLILYGSDIWNDSVFEDDGGIIGPWDDNTDRDTHMVAMYACRMTSSDGSTWEVRTGWTQTTRYQASSGEDYSEFCRTGVLADDNVHTDADGDEGDGGLWDIPDSQSTVRRMTAEAPEARTVISALHGEAPTNGFTAAVGASISGTVTLLVLAPAAVMCALALVIAAMLLVLSPLAIYWAGLPGKSALLQTYRRRLVGALTTFSAFSFILALLVLTTKLMMDLFPISNSVWGAFQLGFYPIAAAFLLHKTVKALGMVSPFTPAGMMAVGGGLLGGVALANWGDAKAAGARVRSVVSRGRGLKGKFSKVPPRPGGYRPATPGGISREGAAAKEKIALSRAPKLPARGTGPVSKAAASAKAATGLGLRKALGSVPGFKPPAAGSNGDGAAEPGSSERRQERLDAGKRWAGKFTKWRVFPVLAGSAAVGVAGTAATAGLGAAAAAGTAFIAPVAIATAAGYAAARGVGSVVARGRHRGEQAGSSTMSRARSVLSRREPPAPPSSPTGPSRTSPRPTSPRTPPPGRNQPPGRSQPPGRNQPAGQGQAPGRNQTTGRSQTPGTNPSKPGQQPASKPTGGRPSTPGKPPTTTSTGTGTGAGGAQLRGNRARGGADDAKRSQAERAGLAPEISTRAQEQGRRRRVVKGKPVPRWQTRGAAQQQQPPAPDGGGGRPTTPPPRNEPPRGAP